MVCKGGVGEAHALIMQVRSDEKAHSHLQHITRSKPYALNYWSKMSSVITRHPHRFSFFQFWCNSFQLSGQVGMGINFSTNQSKSYFLSAQLSLSQ